MNGRVWAGWLALAVFSGSVCAQTRPPVVLLNGYQSVCKSGATSSATFGMMEDLLTAQGLKVYFFDNCTVPSSDVASNGASSGGKPTIEEVSQAFGRFLESLNAPQVDVVAHSMGGLIVRAYLAGMQPGGGFNPPAVTGIRKAILMATPNFGSLALVSLFSSSTADAQLTELLSGSSFEWTINTSNQGSFDFRGVDTIAVAGDNGGSSTTLRTNDGAVPLTSASLAGFLGPDRTRVIAACHVPDLPSFICKGPGIVDVTSASDESYRIVNSFLAGTSEWQTIGNSAGQDPVLSEDGGVDVAVADANGNIMPSTKSVNASQGALVGNSATGIFFGDVLPAGSYHFEISGGGPSQAAFQAIPGAYLPLVVKIGPVIGSVLSATGPLSTLSRAPGMLVTIYGRALSGASVTVGSQAGSQAAEVLYNSDSQINLILPEAISGVAPLIVSTPQGSQTTNVFTAPAVPAIFTLDGTGTGAALAIHADGSGVNSASPAIGGEIVSLYATGLGTAPAALPGVTVGGQAASVLSTVKAGPGLDLVEFIVPGGQTASPASLVMTSGGVTSGSVTLDVGLN